MSNIKNDSLRNRTLSFFKRFKRSKVLPATMTVLFATGGAYIGSGGFAPNPQTGKHLESIEQKADHIQSDINNIKTKVEIKNKHALDFKEFASESLIQELFEELSKHPSADEEMEKILKANKYNSIKKSALCIEILKELRYGQYFKNTPFEGSERLNKLKYCFFDLCWEEKKTESSTGIEP